MVLVRIVVSEGQRMHTDIVCNHYTAIHMRYALRSRAKVLFMVPRQPYFSISRWVGVGVRLPLKEMTVSDIGLNFDLLPRS